MKAGRRPVIHPQAITAWARNSPITSSMPARAPKNRLVVLSNTMVKKTMLGVTPSTAVTHRS